MRGALFAFYGYHMKNHRKISRNMLYSISLAFISSFTLPPALHQQPNSKFWYQSSVDCRSTANLLCASHASNQQISRFNSWQQTHDSENVSHTKIKPYAVIAHSRIAISFFFSYVINGFHSIWFFLLVLVHELFLTAISPLMPHTYSSLNHRHERVHRCVNVRRSHFVTRKQRPATTVVSHSQRLHWINSNGKKEFSQQLFLHDFFAATVLFPLVFHCYRRST